MDDLAKYYFHQGTSSKAYEFLGAHYTEKETTFRVWAPHAKYVSVVGDFNDWNLNYAPMKKISDEGIFEVVIPDVKEFSTYQYAITTYDNRLIFKSDPYAFHSELRPGKSSKVYNLKGYEFHDEEWMKKRRLKSKYSSPLNIYEIHLSSWKKYADDSYFDYVKIASELVDYLKDMHYTHVEVMPLSEYPYDPSWGYQVTGFYSITSRYGTPKDFMKFVDILHQNGFGVILDWVPGHFNKDANGLIEFDGYPLYEPSSSKRMENIGWGTRCFDYGRCEIQSFLVSNAMFFVNEFHIDGLRTDAVSSMLYLDYDRGPGQWEPNSYGTNINLESIAFIKKVNSTVHNFDDSVLMIAEESTAFGNLTKPVEEGGLGYDYKWNMGWMNDTLRYMAIDPYFKGDNKNLISYTMTYGFSEHYILPISHDEVVHLKKSLLSKMPGTYDDKFSHLKTYLTYMLTSPGKKLLFMGCDFGEWDEWNENKQINWSLLSYPIHDSLHDYVRSLNKLYESSVCLYDDTTYWEGFNWLVVDDCYHATFVYKRKSVTEEYIIVLNFANSEWNNYYIPTEAGTYKVLLCSEDLKYHGYLDIINKEYTVADGNLIINIPAHSGTILKKIK